MRLILVAAAAAGFVSAASADGFGFRTPSGNIYCNGALDGGPYLDCTINNREAGSSPAGMPDCPAGRRFDVSLNQTGSVTASCGPAAGKKSTYSEIADYGVTGTFGSITCLSERTGFTCTNGDGHGFSLSRRSQKVY